MRLRLILLPATWLPALIALSLTAYAQDQPELLLPVVTDTLTAADGPPFQLQPFIVRQSLSIRLRGREVPATSFELDTRYGILNLLYPALTPRDTLFVTYRAYPLPFQDRYQRRVVEPLPADTSLSADSVLATRTQQVITANAGDVGQNPFDDTMLQRRGSISRGIIAGNRRDATVESGLRLELSGEVVEGVELQAVLTDENTPILPEGTTQRIDEFDRVYIRIALEQAVAQLGDFDLAFQQSTFARFSRKLQGATVQSQIPDIRQQFYEGGQVTVAGAIARGIFRTQDLAIIDGVQGPYRLEGANNERFILVIPGSEVVYLDGQRLTRGEPNDYTIDYQTAEITFTPRRLMTDDIRIRIEFQYTTNQFTRSLIGTEVLSSFGRVGDQPRVRVGATFIREADSQEFDEEFGLTAADSLAIVQSGDGLATSSGAQVVEYDPQATYTQYVQEVVTAPGGTTDTAFVALSARPPAGTTVYRVRFSRIGPNAGRYIRVGRTVNGIAYQYRGPGLGEYEPVRILPKPKQQRLFDLTTTVQLTPTLQAFGEWARSSDDPNRFTPVQRLDDAVLGGLRLQPTQIGFARWSAHISRRRTGADFVAFDRIRSVEFAREWNLTNRSFSAGGGVLGGGNEQIDEARLRAEINDATFITASYGALSLRDFSASRWQGDLSAAVPRGPAVTYTAEYITSDDATMNQQGTWVRQRGNVRYLWERTGLQPRIAFEQERREQRETARDSLLGTSFAFLELRPSLTWSGEHLELGAEVERRIEDQGLQGSLERAARAWTFQSQFLYRPSRTFSTEGSVGFRKRTFTEPFRLNQQAGNTESVVLSVKGRWQAARQAMLLNWFYEAQTERKPQLQEIFVRTGPGLGQYIWIDTNGNGAIDLDEFQLDPAHGEYAKTFIPSDSLESVIGVDARVRLRLAPGRIWRQADTRWKQIARNIESVTTVDVREESRDPDLAAIYLLDLSRYLSDRNTLNGRLRLLQQVSLFPSHPTYRFDLSHTRLRGLNELAAGQEDRLLRAWEATGRYRLSRTWQLVATATRERNAVFSEALVSRRYDILSRSIEPALSFQPRPSLRLALRYSYADKKDETNERGATVQRIPLEARYALVQRFSLTGRIERARVSLTGDAVGEAQFALTEGRGPGTSYVWSFQGTYSFTQYLNATFSYDGRSLAQSPTLHTVRLTVTAQF